MSFARSRAKVFADDEVKVRFADVAGVDEARCAEAGVSVVRRSTGGLAILHTDEFTYSIALPAGHPIAGIRRPPDPDPSFPD